MEVGACAEIGTAAPTTTVAIAIAIATAARLIDVCKASPMANAPLAASSDGIGSPLQFVGPPPGPCGHGGS